MRGEPINALKTAMINTIQYINDDNYIGILDGWSLTHPSYIVFGFILSAALCFEIVYIDIKFGEK